MDKDKEIIKEDKKLDEELEQEGMAQKPEPNTMMKLEFGALLTVTYAILKLISNQYFFVPEVVGIRIMNILPVAFGLLFGKVGAFSCALGSLFGDVGSGYLTTLSLGGFLGTYGAAYLPYRIWQGMRSEREENIILGTRRTEIMFCVLALTSAVPQSIVLPLFADRFGIAPYTTAFGPLAIQNILFSIIGGFLVYKAIAPRFLSGANHDLWLMVRDHKGATKRLSSALLRLALTALFIGGAFSAIMEPAMGQEVIMYVMGVLSVAILVLVNW